MVNILNWPEFDITGIDEQEHDYLVSAQLEKSETNHCPHCYQREFVGFGRRKELIMDTPIHGKRTGISLNRRRFRCKSTDCSKTFFEPVPHKDDKRQMTERLMRYIERESLKRAFLAIGDEVGVNEKTIRNIFTDYSERMGKQLNF